MAYKANYPPSASSIHTREELVGAVENGMLLIPHSTPGLRKVQPWNAPTHTFDRLGRTLDEPKSGLVYATDDVDILAFSATTGYMGPKPLVPVAAARILLRRNRFHGHTPGEPPFATREFFLSETGKIVLAQNESTGAETPLAYVARRELFEERDGVLAFVSSRAVEAAGSIAVSADVLGVNPYELDSPDGRDWTMGQRFAAHAELMGYVLEPES